MTRRVLASAVLACLLGLAAMAAAGCAKNHRIVIQSDTCWIAKIDGQSTSISEECGNVNFRVAGVMNCVVVNRLAILLLMKRLPFSLEMLCIR